jgi:hypothetical protein
MFRSNSPSAFLALSSSRFRAPRPPDRCAAPALLAGPGPAVALVPVELRGLGVTPDGPGALGVTPGWSAAEAAPATVEQLKFRGLSESPGARLGGALGNRPGARAWVAGWGSRFCGGAGLAFSLRKEEGQLQGSAAFCHRRYGSLTCPDKPAALQGRRAFHFGPLGSFRPHNYNCTATHRN